MRTSVFGGNASCWASTARACTTSRVGESEENLRLMRLLDEQYTRAPFYGSRRMTEWLAMQGHAVNRKRVSRLMEVMGTGGRLSEAEAEPTGRRPQDLPVPAERRDGGARQPGVEHRYHVHQDGAGFRVPGGGDGLVQPVRAELVAVGDDGGGLLPGGAEKCLQAGPSLLDPGQHNPDQSEGPWGRAADPLARKELTSASSLTQSRESTMAAESTKDDGKPAHWEGPV